MQQYLKMFLDWATDSGGTNLEIAESSKLKRSLLVSTFTRSDVNVNYNLHNLSAIWPRGSLLPWAITVKQLCIAVKFVSTISSKYLKFVGNKHEKAIFTLVVLSFWATGPFSVVQDALIKILFKFKCDVFWSSVLYSVLKLKYLQCQTAHIFITSN